MDTLLRPYQAYAATYIDVVVIHTEDWDDHLNKVCVGEPGGAGLTANPKKYHLGLNKAEYLGYTIGSGLIKPQKEKTQLVSAFLGLTEYYRCFLLNYSTIEASLTDLTRKSEPLWLVLTNRAKKAFNELKTVLCTYPVLKMPDFNMPFTVFTDASDTGIGAVLLEGGGTPHCVYQP